MGRDALADVCETVSGAEKSRDHRRSKRQGRNELTRMIGTRPGGVATVIGRQHCEVGPAEPPFKFGQPAVELL
jgi:hypothetical protein